MTIQYVQYALSFGVEKLDDPWKIEFLHPHDANLKVTAYVAMKADDERIGTKINNILVATPGTRLIEVMSKLYDRITKYPYYWPKEGTYIDKFGYDFQVEMNTTDNSVSNVEITESAYEILSQTLDLQPPVVVNGGTVPTIDYVEDGALVKLSITLNHAQPISEINIAPFTKYPMELVSVMYEEDIETPHPKKEIPIPKDSNSNSTLQKSTQSISFRFSDVLAKRITIIIRQVNYEKNTYLVDEDAINQQKAWNDITKREAEVTLDTNDGLETVTQADLDHYSGWDVYLKNAAEFERQLKEWQENVVVYTQKVKERNAKLAEKAAAETQYKADLKEYREDYATATKRYERAVAEYDAKSVQYSKAYSNYQKDLLLYNQYLRDYAEWKSKWG